MQHIDDFAVRGHGAARGKDDGEHGGHADQPQHQKAREHHGSGHGVELLAPGGVGIGAGAVDGTEIALQLLDIGIHRIGQLHDDEAGNGDGGEVESGAEPGLEQGLAFLDGEGPRTGDAGSGLGQRHGGAQIALHHLALHRADLDGEFAPDIGGPGDGRFLYQDHAAQRHRREKGHDGDEQQQGAARHALFGDDGRGTGATRQQGEHTIKHGFSAPPC